jgi:hypothetical protein
MEFLTRTGLLPGKTDPLPTVPAWPEFLRDCVQYRESLDRQLPERARLSNRTWSAMSPCVDRLSSAFGFFVSSSAAFEVGAEFLPARGYR